MSALTTSPAWQALATHAATMRTANLRSLFAADPERFAKLSLRFEDLLLDYSKHLVDAETMRLLLDLAHAADVENWRAMMFEGQKINHTEHRAVLHVALRNRSGRPVMVDGKDVMPDVEGVLARMGTFVEAVRSGAWRGHTGQRITDIVNIGIGGSDLGPLMVCTALAPYATQGLRAHFVSNVDGAHLALTLRGLDPERTLFIVASKTFTTQETMTNASSAREWLLAKTGRRSIGGRQPLRRRLDQRGRGQKVRHRPGQHVRLLGLGRRPLLALVGDRPADRALRRHGAVPGAARRRLRDGRAFPHRPAGGEPAGGAGHARRLVQQLPGRPEPRHPALRPEPRPLRRLLPAGRHGEQRQVRRPRGARGRLPDRPDHLGRARHQRPACLLPADPPGHQADPLRLPRRAPAT